MAARSLLGLLALDSTLAAIRDILLARTGPRGMSHLVGGSQNRLRREFNTLDASDWVYSQSGGASVTVVGGVLTMALGTTLGATATLTSTTFVTAPSRCMVSLGISSKAVGQEAYIELVAVDDAGNLIEDRRAAWRMAIADSATTTTQAVETQNGGPVSRLAVAMTSVPVVGATPLAMLEIELEADETWFHARLPDSTAARVYSFVRQTISPDPNLRYALRIRFVNVAAPAASATLRVGHVLVSDYTELQAEISGSRGGVSPGQALPVVASGGTQTVSGTLSTYGAGVQYTDTTTNLAPGATFTGSQKTASGTTTGIATRYNRLDVRITTDQPGTLILEQAVSMTSPAYKSPPQHSFDITPGVTLLESLNLYTNAARLRFINNGAATTTGLEIISSASR